MSTRIFFVSILVAALVISGCDKKETEAKKSDYAIAVFIPGVVSGSPTYEMLVEGVQKAAGEKPGTTVKVVEGGFNQGEWLDGVTAISATGQYDLIISSNPALPQIAATVAERYPSQRFLILDGHLSGNSAIRTVLYNQMEQAYLVGHFGGLITTSAMPGANSDLKVGLIAGQEYPIMNSVIRVGFELGLKRANPEISLDFRVVGNWYDATRGAELAAGMYDSGVDVILAIAGGANQGVIAEAKRREKYILWYDSNGYSQAPGTVVGSSALSQSEVAYEQTKAAIEGTLQYGVAEIRGVRAGAVKFIDDDPLYIEYVPEPIRTAQRAVIDEIERGALRLQMPVF